MYLKDYDKVKSLELDENILYSIHFKQLILGTIDATLQYENIILQAKESLKQAISFSRNDLSYIMLGKIYLMEGDVHMAIDVYKRAIE